VPDLPLKATGKEMKEVSFLKKSYAKNFFDPYAGCCNVPRPPQQKFFAELRAAKATAYLTQGSVHLP
jgi:hypothetical protein